MLPKRNYGPYGGPLAFSKTVKVTKPVQSHSQAELTKQRPTELTEKPRARLETEDQPKKLLANPGEPLPSKRQKAESYIKAEPA